MPAGVVEIVRRGDRDKNAAVDRQRLYRGVPDLRVVAFGTQSDRTAGQGGRIVNPVARRRNT